MEDKNDVQLLRMIFDATTACLKATECESIAMNGLKVIGALIGKFPGFVGTLALVELQQLIDRYERLTLAAVIALQNAR